MKKRKLIFGCLAGLLFMAFTAMNISVSMSYKQDDVTPVLSLLDLTVKAQTGEEHCTSTINCDNINGSPYYMNALEVNGVVTCCRLAHPYIEGNKQQ